MSLIKIEVKESLNIKITKNLNLRLKRARETARKMTYSSMFLV